MRIDQNLSTLLAQQSKAAEKTNSRQLSSTTAGSSTSESANEGVFATLTISASGIDNARTQRVQALQDAVTSGSYQVEPQKVADSMIASSLSL